MYCVKVSNIINGRTYKGIFNTEKEANDWINSCKSKNSWGKDHRFVTAEDDYEESLVISQEYGVDEYGNATSSIELRAEYDIEGPTFVDVNDNTQEAKQQRLKIAMEESALYKKMVDFGSLVEVYFASMINKRSFSQAQKDELQSHSQILAIREELKFGRIGKAKSMVDSIIPDEVLLFSEDLSKLSVLMQDFIESL